MENRSHHRDPDVIDLLDLLADLSDSPSEEELEDLRGLLTCIVEFRRKPPVNQVNAINRLLGIVSAVVADRVINNQEINFLRKWLDEAHETMQLKDVWPGSVISDRIEQILADGVITEEERENLLETLDALVGNGAEYGVPSGLSSVLDTHYPDFIEFAGASFCFTGKFLYGTRRDCERAVLDRGGKIAKGITKKLHYLVIGTVASRDWAHSSYGRKIEKAQRFTREGGAVQILQEDIWAEFLDVNGASGRLYL